MKCGGKNCTQHVHPICARNSGGYLTTRDVGGRIVHRTFCQVARHFPGIYSRCCASSASSGPCKCIVSHDVLVQGAASLIRATAVTTMSEDARQLTGSLVCG